MTYQYQLVTFAILTVLCFGHLTDLHEDTPNVGRRPAPVKIRRLGVALAPTPVPYEPPGFKPTVTPTDRTKKPTRRPTRPPTKRGPTRPPTKPYPCALCRPKERPRRPNEKIVFNGELKTCQEVDSYGDLKGKIPQDKCDFYRKLGQNVCECKT
jgi:hypothetical protein